MVLSWKWDGVEKSKLVWSFLGASVTGKTIFISKGQSLESALWLGLCSCRRMSAYYVTLIWCVFSSFFKFSSGTRSMHHADGGSEEEICKRIDIARGCMESLTRSSISQSIKLQLYNIYVLPVLLYGSKMWDLIVQSSRQLDVFDQRCLWHILRVHFSARVTNHEIRRHSAEPSVTITITQTIKTRPLKLFVHIVRSDPDKDDVCALNASIDEPPKDWRQPRCCPRQMWLRTIDRDLRQQNFRLCAARHSAQDWTRWRQVMEPATLQQGLPHDDDDDPFNVCYCRWLYKIPVLKKKPAAMQCC